MPVDKSRYESILDNILKAQWALNDWELEFVASVYKQIVEQKKEQLSAKQEEKLLTIQRKAIKYGSGYTRRSWK